MLEEKRGDASREKWSRSDWWAALATGTSVVALSASLLGLYFQFFHVSRDLKASVFNVTYKDGCVLADVAVVNRGNQHEVLLDGRIAYPSEGSGPQGVGFIEFNAPPQPASAIEPVLLAPGDVKMLHLRSRIDMEWVLADRRMNGRLKAKPNEWPVGVRFKALKSIGGPVQTVARVGQLQIGESQFEQYSGRDITIDLLHETHGLAADLSM